MRPGVIEFNGGVMLGWLHLVRTSANKYRQCMAGRRGRGRGGGYFKQLLNLLSKQVTYVQGWALDNDNATLFSGQKIVSYCIIMLTCLYSLWLFHLRDSETLTFFEHFLLILKLYYSIMLSRCRCRETIKMLLAQLCIL